MTFLIRSPNDEITEVIKLNKLLCCPFCGGEPEIKQIGRYRLWIGCKECLMGKKQKVFRYSLKWLAGKMIEDWNKRII